jgi:hypothetical protein
MNHIIGVATQFYSDKKGAAHFELLLLVQPFSTS